MVQNVQEVGKRVRKYRWYIEPLNNETKEDLLRESSEQNIYSGCLCGDHKSHDLCEVSFNKVSFYVKSRINNTFLKFEVWVQEGGGIIRKWLFMGKNYRQRKLNKGMVKRGREAFPERAR